MEESPSTLADHDKLLPEQKMAQYTPLDFSLPRLSANGWEETPKFMKRLESHEEFEFTMSHSMAVRADLYEPATEVSPADELFFRGQLLPLEHDPRLHLVHTLSCIHGEGSDEVQEALNDINCENVVAMEHTGYEVRIHRPNEEDFSMHLEMFPGKCDNEEGFPASSSTAEKLHTIRSSRPDQGILVESCKNDSQSSSFRSQQSSYWGSGEKDSRDSSGSSRCSNGSSQDACYYGTDHQRARAAHHNVKTMPSGSAVCTSISMGVNASSTKGNHHSCSLPHGCKAPLPNASAKVKRWSWKSLFNGLRKASKIWVDDRAEEQGIDIGTKQKKSLLRYASAGQATGSISRPNTEMESQNGYVGGGGMKKLGAMQYAGSSRSKGLGNAESRSFYMQGSARNGGPAPWRAANYYEGNSINGGRAGKQLEKARMGIIAWNARETWQKWVKKPLLHGKVSSTLSAHKGRLHRTATMNEEELDDTLTCTNYSKSLSSTPLMKSPVRKTDIIAASGECDVGNSLKYANLGFAASCPASMRSSPHNSGVLAVITKSPPPAPVASSLHDLHTAIQGAIAHCKQSHTTFKPPAS